jgi:hypothetical protein
VNFLTVPLSYVIVDASLKNIVSETWMGKRATISTTVSRLSFSSFSLFFLQATGFFSSSSSRALKFFIETAA